MRFYLLLSLFITSSLFGQTEQAKGSLGDAVQNASGNTHIILIGVSEYQNLDANKQLNYADDDTELMKKLFERWDNVSIKSFINGEAKGNSVFMAIHNTLNKEAERGDRVIIYFSGHGDVDKDYGEGYLLLSEVTDPNDELYPASAAVLSLHKLEQMMNKAANNGVDVLLITDACKSGSVENARDANQRMLNIGSNTSSMVSCGPDEYSYESPKYGGGHGVFTYYLAQGLMGLADSDGNRIITFKELSRYVEDKVSEAQNNEQNPLSRGLGNKEISDVDPELAKKAEQQEDLTLAMATLETGKSLDPVQLSSSTAFPLLNMLQDLVQNGVFFEDELAEKQKASMTLNDQVIKRIALTPINDLSSNIDGSLIGTSTGNSLTIYRKDLSELTTFHEHNNEVSAFTFQPNRNNVISCSAANDAIYWDANSGEIISEIRELSGTVHAIRFLSTNLLAMGNDAGDLYLWNVNASEAVEKVSIAKTRINDIDFDGRHLFIACANGKIYQFDPITKKTIGSIKAHPLTSSIVIAPMSGKLFSVGSDNLLKAWDLFNLKESFSVSLDPHDSREAYDENINIQLDLFENYCFVGSSRHNLDVIDLNNKTLTKRFAASRNGLASLQFNPTTNILYFGDSEGRLYINDLSIDYGSFSALQIHQMLIRNPENEKIQYKIDGTVIVGLNNYVSEVLNPLVNGKAYLPSIEEISKARRYAEKAFELGRKYEIDNVKLEINLLLLEIFEIIQGKNIYDFKTALNKIERITSLDPNVAYAYNISGALLSELKQFEAAKKNAQKAEELAPLWTEATCGNGKVLFKEGDHTGAEAKFKETIQKGSGLSKGYFNLGKLYSYIGRFDEGAVQLDLAMDIDKDVEFFVANRIENAFCTGDLVTVYKLAEKYSAYDYSSALIAKANVQYMENGVNSDYPALYELYKKATIIDAKNVDALNALAFFYLRLRGTDMEEDFVAAHLSAFDSKNVLKRETSLLFNKVKRIDENNILADVGSWILGGYKVDTAVVENMLNRNNYTAEAYAAVGRYYLFKEDVQLALHYLKSGIDAHPSDYRCYILTMEANERIGKSGENKTLKDAFIKNNPKSDALKYKDQLLDYIFLY